MGHAVNGHDDEPLGYRPVSGLAVAALVAGALSATAVISPVFWVVPLLAVGLACLGLTDVQRSGAEKVGRVAALGGLALAIGFGAQSVAATLTTRWISSARAQAAAGLWIEALQHGRADDARAMCLPDTVPQLDDLVREVEGCRNEARPMVVVIGRGAGSPDTWRVRATVKPCAGGTFDVIIELANSTVSHQEGPVERWTVVACEPAG